LRRSGEGLDSFTLLSLIHTFSGKKRIASVCCTGCCHTSKSVKTHWVLREPWSQSDPWKTNPDCCRGVCSLQQLLFKSGSSAIPLLEDNLCGVVSKDQGECGSKDGQEKHHKKQNLLEAEESREKVATKTTVAEHKDTDWIPLDFMEF